MHLEQYVCPANVNVNDIAPRLEQQFHGLDGSQRRCSTIHKLEDDHLEQIFSSLCFEERLVVLPRVCTRWACLLRKPSAVVWETMDIELEALYNRCNDQAAAGRPLLAADVASPWFGRHANCVRQLSIADSLRRNTRFMAPVAAAAIFGSQCSSLLNLQIEAVSVGLAGDECAALAVLTRLTFLKVTMHNTLLEDRAAPLLRTVQRLPALADLDLNYEGRFPRLNEAASAGNGLPRCEELAELHSRSLTRLRVSILEGPEGATPVPLRLSALPELRSCELLGSASAEAWIKIDATSFERAPQLQKLYLDNVWALDLQDGALAQLDALTSLAMIGCGLQKVPADVVSLRHTLCELDLSKNEHLQLDSAAAACIVQNSRLRILSLSKPDLNAWAEVFDENSWNPVRRHMIGLGYAPALWSSDSVRHLVELPCAFYMRHGRHLQLRC